MRGRWLRRGTGLGLLLMVGLSWSISPGVRHTHEQGDVPHHHHHGHHHAHTHGHGHSHAHQHPHSQGTTHRHDHAATITATHSHTHFRILWFEVTLPDLRSVSETFASRPMLASAGTVAEQETSAWEDGPSWSGWLTPLLLLAGAPLPHRAGWLRDLSNAGHMSPWTLSRGRLRDEPALPPPRHA